MEIYLDCLPCFLRQVLEASRLLTKDYILQKAIMRETVEILMDIDRYRYSPEVGRAMHNIVKKHTGIEDPYKQIKEESIKASMDIYPLLKRFLYRKKDRLYWGLKIAATGNIIDSAINKDIDIEGCLENELQKEFTICDIGVLQERLKTAKTLLIIGDNAGETVFDIVLIEDFVYLDITYAVRSEPIINDATEEDACASGLNQCSKIISTGCSSPGLILEESSEEFRYIYEKADIVISKGQGNYETLSDQKRDMFFLLKAKCPVIADKIGVYINDFVFINNT